MLDDIDILLMKIFLDTADTDAIRKHFETDSLMVDNQSNSH